MMIRSEPVKFYLNHPAPCPYLPDRDEQRILIPLAHDAETAQEQTSFFTRLGFRRSQNMLYRPQCPSCNACISLRILASQFRPSATQARLHRRNHDLIWRESTLAECAVKHYELFETYQKVRHNSSEMAKFDRNDFRQLLESAAPGNTCFTLTDPLTAQVIGVILSDRTDDGYSAVYSFYNPAYPSRSLGTELVLRLIDQARHDELPFVYLGYWIKQCAKMSYKDKFRPAEILGAEGWSLLIS